MNIPNIFETTTLKCNEPGGFLRFTYIEIPKPVMSSHLVLHTSSFIYPLSSHVGFYLDFTPWKAFSQAANIAVEKPRALVACL